jgi:hypothetical protein
MKAADDLLFHSPQKREGPRRVGTFQLNPNPGIQPDKLFGIKIIPGIHEVAKLWSRAVSIFEGKESPTFDSSLMVNEPWVQI